MKITLSPAVIKLANMAAKIPGIKRILKPWYYKYKDRINRNRNMQFHKNGMKVLELFDKVMTENNIPYTVFAGTLLGTVREKGFISNDLDIDTAIFYCDRPDNISQLLASSGFKLLHKFTIGNGIRGMEETYVKDDVTLDIFYIYIDAHGGTYQCDFYPEKDAVTWEDSMKKYGYVKARRLEFPVSHAFVRLPFANISVSAISNYSQWLSCRYGTSYMIPDPNFHDVGTNPYIIIEWSEAVYEKY